MAGMNYVARAAALERQYKALVLEAEAIALKLQKVRFLIEHGSKLNEAAIEQLEGEVEDEVAETPGA